MNKEAINFYITPQIAATLVKLYYQLKTNPQADQKELQDLEIRLREISEFNKWEFDDTQQIVDHLAFIATTADKQEQEAAVPPNLEELVKTYIEYEKKLSQAQTTQAQIEISQYKEKLEKQRALLATLSPEQQLKVDGVVHPTTGSVYEHTRGQIKEENLKEAIENAKPASSTEERAWIEEQRALRLAGLINQELPANVAHEVVKILENRNKQGEALSIQELRAIVNTATQSPEFKEKGYKTPTPQELDSFTQKAEAVITQPAPQNLVPEFQTKRAPFREPTKDEAVADKEETPLEPKKEQIAKWVEDARQTVRIQKMVIALERANVPSNYAESIAKKIVEKTNTQGEKESAISEIQFSQAVFEAIKEQDLKDRDKLTPHSGEVVETITNRAKSELPEILTILRSSPEIDIKNAPTNITQSFRRPQDRPRFTSTEKIDVETEGDTSPD